MLLLGLFCVWVVDFAAVVWCFGFLLFSPFCIGLFVWLLIYFVRICVWFYFVTSCFLWLWFGFVVLEFVFACFADCGFW